MNLSHYCNAENSIDEKTEEREIKTMKTNNILVAALALGALMLPALAQADPYNGNVNARLNDQHVRIEQGVRDGQLNRGEQFDLSNRDREIRFQANQDRFFHDGRLTNGERARLNGELNHNSGTIYFDRHNDCNR
jgi:hypothetical protein